MRRPITLFTGQWADLPFEEVCALAGQLGYDGLEIATWGRHLDVERALDDPAYVDEIRRQLERHGLVVHAVSNHLAGQLVCDRILDERHRAIAPDSVWGDGDIDGVRKRATERMIGTARVASALGAGIVTGFAGSPIWHMLAMFPPVTTQTISDGYTEFARVWRPIQNEFDAVGVRFALEIHPAQIAYDYWTARRIIDELGDLQGFGFNLDPSHFAWQGLDPARFVHDFGDRIFHVHCKDTRLNLDGRGGRLASHLPWNDPRRGWRFASIGHGVTDWEALFQALDWVGYTGPVSVEWEDESFPRLAAAEDALRRLRELERFERVGSSADSTFAAPRARS